MIVSVNVCMQAARVARRLLCGGEAAAGHLGIHLFGLRRQRSADVPRKVRISFNLLADLFDRVAGLARAYR